MAVKLLPMGFMNPNVNPDINQDYLISNEDTASGFKKLVDDYSQGIKERSKPDSYFGGMVQAGWNGGKRKLSPEEIAFQKAQSLGPTPYSSQGAQDEKNILLDYLSRNQNQNDIASSSQDPIAYSENPFAQSPLDMNAIWNPPMQDSLESTPVTPQDQIQSGMDPTNPLPGQGQPQDPYAPLTDYYRKNIDEQRQNLETLRAYRDKAAAQKPADNLKGLGYLADAWGDRNAGAFAAEQRAKTQSDIDKETLAGDLQVQNALKGIGQQELGLLQSQMKLQIARDKKREKPKFKQNEWQAATFAARAKDAEKIIENLGEKGEFDPTTGKARFQNSFIYPEGAKNKQMKLFDAAKRNLVTAILRKESGAAIPPEELEQEFLKYIPQWGDDAATIEAKKQARKRAVEGLVRESSGAFEEFDPTQSVPLSEEGSESKGLSDEELKNMTYEQKLQKAKEMGLIQ